MKNRAYETNLLHVLRKLALPSAVVIVAFSLSAYYTGLPPMWIVGSTALVMGILLAIYIKNYLPLIRMMPRSLSFDDQCVIIGFAKRTERIELRDIVKVVPQQRFEIHLKNGSVRLLYGLSPELSRALYLRIPDGEREK